MIENISTLLFEPFTHGFMLRGALVVLLVSIICAVLSCYLVLKGWSLMGDAVSHAVLPGIVLAAASGIPLVVGAFLAGVLCAYITGYIHENSRVKEDTVMGVVFSGMFAIGLVLFTKLPSDEHLLHILFGNVLGVTWDDIYETSAIAAITMAILTVKWRDFQLYCFDPGYARVIGLPVRMLHYILLMLLALTIVASLKATGIILVISMLIAPGAIAFLLTKRLQYMLLIAPSAAMLCGILGMLMSYYIDAASAPCIVVLQAVMFLVAFWLRRDKRRMRAAAIA